MIFGLSYELWLLILIFAALCAIAMRLTVVVKLLAIIARNPPSQTDLNDLPRHIADGIELREERQEREDAGGFPTTKEWKEIKGSGAKE
jgi:hypothetical protein